MIPETHWMVRLDRVWRRHRRWRRRPQSAKEAIIRALKGVRPDYDDFWAVSDVSFDVRRGEILGFCGPNGAGKSTLLKVVAGIVPPTHGTVTVRGRIATLLELGAGFLPDLTGRENVALNGAILGLTDAEIRAKTEAIVAFADLGDFIDSPVRIYSSGMYTRLGFAIASHVEADILLIDEVLAVGDAEFQAKCAGWLDRLRDAGCTVLLVSHDLGVLRARCDRVAWMEQGRLRACGDPDEVVDAYVHAQSHRETVAAEPIA